MSGPTRRELTIRLARAKPEEKARIIRAMSWQDVLLHDADFECWSHESQIEPVKDGWRSWLMMAGRGFGKTRAGAEWIEKLARSRPEVRIALVGASIDEARRIMVEGVSGLLSVAKRNRSNLKWEPGIGRLTWSNGSQAQLFSGDSPDGLRGPEHDFAWADELAKWRQRDAAWAQHADHLAAFTSGGWRFLPPAPGMVALVKSSGLAASYSGSSWEAGTIRAERVLIDGVQVLAARVAAIPDPAGGSVVDAEARSTLVQILSALRVHGLIAAD